MSLDAPSDPSLSPSSFAAKAGLNEPSVPRDSQIGGVSVRSIITLMVTGVLCFHTIAAVVTAVLRGDVIGVIQEPLYGITYVVIGYYFGAMNKQPSPSTTNGKS